MKSIRTCLEKIMGLDLVELVLGLEDEFRIKIPDEEASKLETAGDLYLFVIKALKEESRVPPEVEEDGVVWERVKKIVVAQLGVKPEEILKESHLVYDLGAD